MRAGIGLVGLLLAVGLIVWLFSAFSIPTAREGKKAQEKAAQISGRGQDAVPAHQSFATQGEFKGSKLDSLTVTSVTPGGAMDTHFGLKVGDAITAVNGIRVNDVANGDEEMAKALISEAFSKQQPLTVRRGGRQVTLPLPPGAGAAAAPAASPAATDGTGLESQAPADTSSASPPPAPQPQPQPQKSRGLQGQLEDIQNAAGGGRQQD